MQNSGVVLQSPPAKARSQRSVAILAQAVLNPLGGVLQGPSGSGLCLHPFPPRGMWGHGGAKGFLEVGKGLGPGIGVVDGPPRTGWSTGGGKSGGPAGGLDWICYGCGFGNFSWREYCKRCLQVFGRTKWDPRVVQMVKGGHLEEAGTGKGQLAARWS